MPFGLNDEKTHHKGELFYPNLMISLSMDHVAAFYVWPGHWARVRCDFLFILTKFHEVILIRRMLSSFGTS